MALAIAVVGVAGSGPPTPEDLLPVLVAMAASCVVGLTHRHRPSIAWIAAVTALTVATLDCGIGVRGERLGAGLGDRAP